MQRGGQRKHCARPCLDAHVTVAKLSFAICFAAWGVVSASAPYLRATFKLSGFQTALLVAVPVLLGALARLPIGMLADRFAPAHR